MDTIENKLKELILNKYKSLREFTLKIEMPYSTFDTILKRGVRNANIINILKICNELNIDPYKLSNGIIEYNDIKNSIDLSKEERDLLENYNELNNYGKKKVIIYTKDLIEMPKYQKENNISQLPKKEKQIWEEEGKEYLMPKASHSKEGNFTEEDYKHDDDLMNDEDIWK
ncbi:hypothetical protein [Clostridium fallax]|uniref:Cro/C1-type HTH DNA-binding domain-containing protein n=1 Tax=Clostridium fallax TaxID=1533 RepID=A0A1M4ZCY6_9CLOT|nr:hypothetical protein [Clostridium fallax]SHF15456.1 hypothetical protein SAMN05443638_14117 [Clostridium fallax]SQB22262.1 putative transcriptional regulator [Clostridium fallax]